MPPRIIFAAFLVGISLEWASAQAPRADLMPLMQEFTQALGVQCQYCHSAERGSGQPEPRKDIARQMMAMTTELNAKVQAATGKPAGEAARVQCVTCHRGVPIPRQLSEIVTRTINEKGVAAAVEQYRGLHKQFYGRAAYDFGENTLLNIAQIAVQRGRADDSIALLKLNLEIYPQSANSYGALAYAYTRKFDDATAMMYLEKALEIEPGNGVIRGQLEQLKSYRRRK
jgi:tetratricopeptide (TPR) repeat protein